MKDSANLLRGLFAIGLPIGATVASLVVTVACSDQARRQASLPGPPRATPPDPNVVSGVEGDAPSVGSIRFDDPECKRVEAHGDETIVDCPEDLLPAQDPGELVVSVDGASCFRVAGRKPPQRYNWDQGRVRCPPNVRLPAMSEITIGENQFHLNAKSLTCSRIAINSRWPWKLAECPAALVPVLVGLEPDGACSYRGVRVNCSLAGAPDTAYIIAASATADGSLITISRGTNDGVIVGMTLQIRGVRELAIIDACSQRTCTARVPLAVDSIDAADHNVTFLK